MYFYFLQFQIVEKLQPTVFLFQTNVSRYFFEN